MVILITNVKAQLSLGCKMKAFDNILGDFTCESRARGATLKVGGLNSDSKWGG